MLNKVKRILQWFIGGCYILSGLAYIGEYTMPAIILIILGGVIILPPITKRIPAFKFKKIALILLSSIAVSYTHLLQRKSVPAHRRGQPHDRQGLQDGAGSSIKEDV